jgi:hypothetical protein
MARPPYDSPSGGHPMSRFALFTVALFALVLIGSQPRHGRSLSESLNSMCVCMPTRAGLIVKSAIARTQAEVRSAELSTMRATVGK